MTTGQGAYDYLEPPIDYKQEIARVNFLMALFNLETRGVVNNPRQRLRDETWPKWHEILHHREAAPRRLLYHEHCEEQLRRQAAANEVLAAWARDCWLLEQSGDNASRPAEWILARAREWCQEWSRNESGVPSEPWWARIRPTEDNATDSSSIDLQAPAPLGGLAIPMAHPSPLPGEPSRDFKRRVRAALTVHLQQLERSRAARPKKRTDLQKSRPYKLDHYEWLILHQCCKCLLKSIRQEYRYINTDQAVWMGLKEKATLIGLELRPKRS